MKTTANAVARSATGCAACVSLSLTHSTAQEVCIAGSFNDWHPTVTPMIRLENGRWAKELVLPPGRYEYRFVVDGEWVDDPAATELIPNTFGTANALLVVTEIIRSVDAANNRAIAANPRAKEMFPRLTRGTASTPTKTAVLDVTKNPRRTNG